jgi:hypothetical protein
MSVKLMIASAIMLLQECASSGAEASTNLDLADLTPLLKSVQRLIQSGFGDAEVAQIGATAKSTPVKQTKELEFQTVFHGARTAVRLQIKKDDVDVVSVWFITSPELAREIQTAMKPFLH